MSARPPVPARGVDRAAVMAAAHVVYELATCQPHLTGELTRRLPALVRHIRAACADGSLGTFRVALARLLHVAVGKLSSYGRLPLGDAEHETLLQHLREDSASTKELAVSALDCPDVEHFVHLVGDEAKRPADPVEIAVTTGAVLRALLRVHTAGQDPMTRWVVLSGVTADATPLR